MSVTGLTSSQGTIDGSPLEERHNYDVQVINGIAHRIHKVVVHRFQMSDVEDPEIYVAQPLWEWQQSEEGKWIMAHAIESPIWHRHNDITSFTIQYAITAKLIGRDYTFWVMKWGSQKSK